jgi:hypothetical protein
VFICEICGYIFLAADVRGFSKIIKVLWKGII